MRVLDADIVAVQEVERRVIRSWFADQPALIARAGSGKNDAKWVANADWQNWVREMEKISLQIRSAALSTGTGP